MARENLGLLQGTVDVLILRTVSSGMMHGYGISRWIRERSEGALLVEDAALYQALHRLERKGWVESEWGLSDANRRAKYYRITRQGRAALQTHVADIRTYVDALMRVLLPA
jgi:PadR family transcriptional regulator, regulatory protein PadR